MKIRRAFAIVELAASLAAVGMLLCMLLVCAKRTRGNAWQAGSLANLHEFATVTTSYAADNSDQFWSFTWQPGAVNPSAYPDINQAILGTDALGASAAQAVDILRRRTGVNITADMIGGWFPNTQYSHLVLAEYLGANVPLRFAVSPGDKYRQLWSNDPQGFLQNAYGSDQPDATEPTLWCQPFRSSYRVMPPFFSPDASTPTTGCIINSGDTAHWQSVSSTLGTGIRPRISGRHTSEVVYPSQKVMIYDLAQWEGKQPVYYAYPMARVPMLLADCSAGVRATATANLGFHPENPRYPFYTMLPFNPFWETPVISGMSSNLILYYAWTRGGIRGRDFEGQETNTSNW